PTTRPRVAKVPPTVVVKPGDLRQPGGATVGDAVDQTGLQVVGEVVHEVAPRLRRVGKTDIIPPGLPDSPSPARRVRVTAGFIDLATGPGRGSPRHRAA